MNRIVGDGLIPEAQAFYDVRDALKFDEDVYLAAMWSNLFRVKLSGEVIYNMEPLYDGCRSFTLGYLETLKRNIVLDYDRGNVEYLKRFGINAFHLPYGYHASLERVKPVAQDIDVLFVGSRNERRERLLKRFPQEFKFVWAQGFYGKQLDDLIARAKVHLNVHYCEDHPLEVVRLNYLMANHCTVVSERGNDDEVNGKYESGIIFSADDELIDKCREDLINRKDGYECIKSMPHSNEAAQMFVRRMICLGAQQQVQ
jgi:hypothetical protein